MKTRNFILSLVALFIFCGVTSTKAQVMKVDDLEKYAKEKYGEKWIDAAANLASQLKLDKNQSLTYQEVIECGNKTKDQLYLQLNYWATSTFNKDKQAITLNDKEAGCIIISSTIDAIADHTGTLNRYVVSITPIIRIDIKEGRIRVTYTVPTYDILKAENAGWIGALADDTKYGQKNQNLYSDGKRLKKDNTDHRLYDEQWEIAKHYPFVEKDNKKRTSAKALVMTHAYSNVVMDKIKEAVTKGIVGNEDEDW